LPGAGKFYSQTVRQKVVTKRSQKTAQKLLHELQTVILSTQKRNSLVSIQITAMSP